MMARWREITGRGSERAVGGTRSQVTGDGSSQWKTFQVSDSALLQMPSLPLPPNSLGPVCAQKSPLSVVKTQTVNKDELNQVFEFKNQLNF